MHLMPREGTETIPCGGRRTDHRIMHLMPREGTETFLAFDSRPARRTNASYAP